jgi:hypothetical protein
MDCMACGAEMVLMNVVQDDTIIVPGFEQRTFICCECQEEERRLVFAKQGGDGDTYARAGGNTPGACINNAG